MQLKRKTLFVTFETDCDNFFGVYSLVYVKGNTVTKSQNGAIITKANTPVFIQHKEVVIVSKRYWT